MSGLDGEGLIDLDGSGVMSLGQRTRAWVVAPRGEVDIATCGELAASLDEVIQAGATVLVLDLGGVDFLDSSGIRVIVRAARELEELGGRLLIENASGATQRTLEVTGILEQLREPMSASTSGGSTNEVVASTSKGEHP
jgi:anti-anti-sigma factor